MSETLISSLASTVTGQIGQLALAAAVLLGLALVLLVLGRRLRSTRPRPPLTEADQSARRAPAGSAGAVLLVGVLVLAVLALILAAGLRQVWGHPILQPRVLWMLVAVVVALVLVWWRSNDGEAPS